MKNILLDTDVVLDFLLDRKPFSDDTLHILLKCEKKEMNAFVTPPPMHDECIGRVLAEC